MVDAESKLLCTTDDDDWNFKQWRQCDALRQYRSDMESSAKCRMLGPLKRVCNFLLIK